MNNPEPALLLPYQVTVTPASTSGATPLTTVHFAVGADPEGRTAWPVRCAQISLALPVRAGAAIPRDEPVFLRTKLANPPDGEHGRNWHIHADTTDPAVTVLDLVPEEPAVFDGSWEVAVTVEISTPLDQTVRLSEQTAAGTDQLAARAGTSRMTIR
ncbi:hypothetical protein ABH920_001391 [Catenulispora sp. EB89]|uniref:hypothetical protein n=1 Tax=Catenulispora sp. EB89 TaxID=3156257 RepID=UPI00351689B5